MDLQNKADGAVAEAAAVGEPQAVAATGIPVEDTSAGQVLYKWQLKTSIQCISDLLPIPASAFSPSLKNL